MARTINYRVKAGPGALQRAVIDESALPQSITGLVNGTTYEVDTGFGTWVDVTPAASGVILTGLTRVDATTASGTTATRTAYPIAAATGTHLLVSILSRSSNVFTGGTVAINGGSPVTMTSTGGGAYSMLWAVVPNPGGSTMDISVTGSGGSATWGSTSDTAFYVSNMSATGSITASAQNSKDIQTTDTTFSVSLNVPSSGAVAAIFHPRFTDGLTPSLAVLSSVDVDGTQGTAGGTQSRIWASRDGLAANATYVIDTTVRRSAATQAAFGAVVIGA